MLRTGLFYKFAAVTIVCSILALVVVYARSVTAAKGYNIGQLRKELEKSERENAALKFELMSMKSPGRLLGTSSGFGLELEPPSPTRLLEILPEPEIEQADGKGGKFDPTEFGSANRKPVNSNKAKSSRNSKSKGKPAQKAKQTSARGGGRRG